MRNRGPIFTLLAVGGLAAVLFGVNMANTSNTSNTSNTAGGYQPAGPAIATATPSTPPATATATPPADETDEAAYAGRTSRNEAAIAIAVKDGKAVAYFCDGKRAEAWLTGRVSGGTLTLAGKKGASLTGTVAGDASSGTVRVGGKSWPYSAKIAKAPAGLYRGDAAIRGVQNRIGWIVLQDGEQVGIRNAGGDPTPAPELDPTADAVMVDGTQVPVETVSGSDGDSM
jgi:hypothetical protein